MYKILVMDPGPLDRAMIAETVSSGLRSTSVHTTCCLSQAAEWLDQESANLLIVDMAHSPVATGDLIHYARSRCACIEVLLTSVGREEQVSFQVMKLGVEQYLLKPFRPAQLMAIVAPRAQKFVESEGRLGAQEQTLFLDRLYEAIKECAYKKCVEIAKEYIAFLYQSTDNMAVIRTRTLEFANGLTGFGQEFGPDVQWRLAGCLERFRSRYDLQGRKYDVCAMLEEMLDAMFEAMEKEALYSDDALKKALNYIDRNIKKGINLDDAAEYVNMSSCYFSKFFKKATGDNFISYVTDRKIEYAKDMLRHTEMPVINIAYELSYSETNYFSKAFKKKVGQTPTEYRMRHLKLPERKTAAELL